MWDKIRRHRAGNIAIVFILVQVICIVASLIWPDRFAYLDKKNIQVLLKAIPPQAILATGVGMLMIAGEFDLSVGSTFTLSALLMAMSFNSGLSIWVAAPLGLLLGAGIGLLNATIVLRAKMPSFIATLGTMMILRGVILVSSGSHPAPFHPGGFFEKLFTINLFSAVQVQFVWLVGVAGLAYLLMERHKFGNHIYATGGNKQSAFAIGVSPDRVKLICFVLVGVLAALSGLISTTRVSSISPEQGRSLELQAIAACVIGGISLSGGEGTIIGILLGSALFFTIQNVLSLLGVSGLYNEMMMGLLIVIAVIFNNLTKKD